MFQKLLAVATALVIGMSAASAATVHFELKDPYASSQNVYVELQKVNGPSQPDETLLRLELMSNSLNSFTLELGAGDYHLWVNELSRARIVQYYALFVDGELITSCNGCQTPRHHEFTITEPAPVPLPASAGLLLAGLGGLAFMRRRRKQA